MILVQDSNWCACVPAGGVCAASLVCRFRGSRAEGEDVADSIPEGGLGPSLLHRGPVSASPSEVAGWVPPLMQSSSRSRGPERRRGGRQTSSSPTITGEVEGTAWGPCGTVRWAPYCHLPRGRHRWGAWFEAQELPPSTNAEGARRGLALQKYRSRGHEQPVPSPPVFFNAKLAKGSGAAPLTRPNLFLLLVLLLLPYGCP